MREGDGYKYSVDWWSLGVTMYEVLRHKVVLSKWIKLGDFFLPLFCLAPKEYTVYVYQNYAHVTKTINFINCKFRFKTNKYKNMPVYIILIANCLAEP